MPAYSLQCWCFHCAGKRVARNTWRKHGRHRRPIPPIPGAEAAIPVASNPLPPEEAADPGVSDESSSDSDNAPGFDPLQLLRTEADEGDGEGDEGDDDPVVGPAALTAGEVVVLLLDHISAHKGTDAGTKDLWQLVSALVPSGMTLPTWPSVKNLLEKIDAKYCKRIEICKNDCIAYWDSRWLPDPYRHSHRTHCPVCGEDRRVVDPRDGKTRAVKTIYFFPLAPFVRSLFARPDLVPHLYADAGDRERGEVTRTRGFKHKVLDNPHMNVDHRNLGLIGTTDGVPLFEDQKRGAWIFVNRVANLPHGLSTNMANVHMHMLSGNEHFEVDEHAGVLRRIVRGPKSLVPHLHILVDDYLHAYQKGYALQSRYVFTAFVIACRHLAGFMPATCIHAGHCRHLNAVAEIYVCWTMFSRLLSFTAGYCRQYILLPTIAGINLHLPLCVC